MVSKIEHLPKSTVRLTVAIPEEEVKETRKKVVADLASKVKVDGFRQGKAPKELIEEKLDEGEVRAEIINRLVPRSYSEAAGEQKIIPFSNPRIEIKKFEAGGDLVFEATVPLKPEVELGNYKKLIKEDSKDESVVYGPDGEPAKSKGTGQKEKTDEGGQMSKALEALLKETKVEISDLLIEEEVNRMLSRLLDQLQQLNLTVEQYLSSRNQTAEDLKSGYRKVAEENLKLEFVLHEIAEKEGIAISDEELEAAIKNAPDEDSHRALEDERGKAYIKHILRNRKVLELLTQRSPKRTP